jgi:hypothetical protein
LQKFFWEEVVTVSRLISLSVLLCCLIVLAAPSPSFAATAAEILAWCRPESPQKSLSLCEGYVSAIAEIASKRNRIADNIGVACIPENTKVELLTELVVKQLPSVLGLSEKSGFDAIAPIFVEKFPCQK